MRIDVAVPHATKETFFFDRYFETKKASWYFQHFRSTDWTKIKRTIEVAPTYFAHPAVPSRVATLLGQIQIVVTLRDPADRAFSLFQHMKRYGLTKTRSFRDCVAAHPEMVETSKYFESIQRWTRLFGPEKVTTLFMEDLASDPRTFCNACCDGLSISRPNGSIALPEKTNVAVTPRHFQIARFGRISGDLLRSCHLHNIIQVAKQAGMKRMFFGNPQQQRRRISCVDRAWFVRQIEHDLRALERLVNRDLNHWLKPKSQPVGATSVTEVMAAANCATSDS